MKYHNKCLGFTLAEVLITLGVIGVVAALTLPSIIIKYRKNVVETRLEKFYSVMNQAFTMAVADNGDIYADLPINSSRVDASQQDVWYKKYILKHLKAVSTSTSVSTYYKVLLADGSAFFSSMSTDANNFYIYFYYCVNASKCTVGNFDGKNQFLFRYNPDNKKVEPNSMGLTIDQLKRQCYANTSPTQRHGCVGVIMKNGWKIPDDYPWIH